MAEEVYDIATDFTALVTPGPDTDVLHAAVVADPAIPTPLDAVNADPTDVRFVFPTALPPAEKTALDAIVAAHAGDEAPDAALTETSESLQSVLEGRHGIEVELENQAELVPEPVVQYFFNEATSGTASTVQDNISPPLNLPVDVESGEPVYVATPTGTALEWTAVNLDAGPCIAVDGTKVATALQGALKFTIGTVSRVDAVTPLRSRLFSIGTGSNSGRVALITDDTNELVVWVNNQEAGAFNVGLTSRRVIHVVYDSTEPNPDDRCKCYQDGMLVSRVGGSGTPGLNETVDLLSGREFCLGKRGGDGNRSFDGRLSYSELYSEALTPAQITTLATNLAADDDSDPRPASVAIDPKVVIKQGRIFPDEDRSVSTNNTDNWVTKLRVPFVLEKQRRVRLDWYAEWGHSSTSTDGELRVVLDDNTADPVAQTREEPKDSGSDQRTPFGGFRIVTLAAGSHTLDLDFRSANDSGTTTVYLTHLCAEVKDDG